MKQLTVLASSGATGRTQQQQSPENDYEYYPIVVLGGPMRNALIDKYYQRFRDELFLYDDKNDNCCAQLPEPDEVVFVRITVRTVYLSKTTRRKLMCFLFWRNTIILTASLLPSWLIGVSSSSSIISP
jgi:hypothetical protein